MWSLRTLSTIYKTILSVRDSPRSGAPKRSPDTEVRTLTASSLGVLRLVVVVVVVAQLPELDYRLSKEVPDA